MNRTNLNSEDVKKVNRYTLFSETPPSGNLFFFFKGFYCMSLFKGRLS